jgi:hypothetical protein
MKKELLLKKINHEAHEEHEEIFNRGLQAAEDRRQSAG